MVFIFNVDVTDVAPKDTTSANPGTSKDNSSKDETQSSSSALLFWIESRTVKTLVEKIVEVTDIVEEPLVEGQEPTDTIVEPQENIEDQNQNQKLEDVALNPDENIEPEPVEIDDISPSQLQSRKDSLSSRLISSRQSSRQTSIPQVLQDVPQPPPIPPQVEELEYITSEVTELHLSLSHFPAHVSDSNAMYILKNHPGPVRDIKSLEIGCFSNALGGLEGALRQVYIPLLSNGEYQEEEEDIIQEEEEGKEVVKKTRGKFYSMKGEIVLAIQRFSAQISHIVQQVAGETRLKIPEDLSSLESIDIATVKENEQMVHSLELLAEEWIEIVSGALAKEARKTPIGLVFIY